MDLPKYHLVCKQPYNNYVWAGSWLTITNNLANHIAAWYKFVV